MIGSRKAVVLLSGGLDSTTLLAIAADAGFHLYAMTFTYGQRHAIEVEAARRVAAAFHAEQHVVVDIDLTVFGGSALTAEGIAVPKHNAVADLGDDIPVTYVPARNTIFLAYALAWAEVLGSGDVFIGVNAVDYSGYPDCRPEFIAAFQRVAQLATKAAVEGQALRIHTPLIDLSKAQIIGKGLSLGVDYALTHSCYDPAPDGRACGRCDSCLLRRRGFLDAGVPDPTVYVDA